MKKYTSEAIQNALKGMQVDPPESLVFDVMAKVRALGAAPKPAPRGLVFGLGLGAVAVAALALVLTFALPGRSPDDASVMVSQKSAPEMADNLAPSLPAQPPSNEFPGGAAMLAEGRPAQLSSNDEGFYIIRTVTTHPESYLDYLSRSLSSPTLATQDGLPTVTVLVPSNQLDQVLGTITAPPEDKTQYQINRIQPPPQNDGMVRLLIHVTK